MSITIQGDFTGQVGVNPRIVRAVSTDPLATVLSAGYLNNSNLQGTVLPTDILAINYNGGTGWFIPSIVVTSGTPVVTLSEMTPSVTIPTVVDDIAVFTNVNGSIGDGGTVTAAAGGLQAGYSGTAGVVTSYPATASKGTLVLAAVNNTGNTATTISNAAMGQASVISIPDPGASTAKFVLDHGTTTMAAGSSIVLAKVNGTESSNAVTASGQSGVITTSSLTTAGGSSYAITWTNTFISSTSTILLTIMGGTNTTENITLKATAGSGSSTLTIYNNTAATALNGTILIGYVVL